MRIKSYFTESVHEAMQKARFELGPEALLLSSKRAAQPDSTGSYEVVFGISDGSCSRTPVQTVTAAPMEAEVAKQLADLRQQIENLQRSLTSPASNRTRDRDELMERLVALGFSPGMAQKLAEGSRTRATSGQTAEADNQQPMSTAKTRAGRATTRKRGGRVGTSGIPSADCAPDALFEEIDSRFSVAPELGSADSDQKVVLLVGPPGAGKTTTLVKLAIAYGTSRKVPLHILSTDTLRLGGAEQLQAYSRILGAAFHAVAGRRTLEQTFEEVHAKKLVLIDSPGFGPADMEETGDLAAFVEQHAHVDVQLVLPATLQAPAMASALQRFRIFRPSKLVFTHIDEMESPASLLEAAIRSGIPVSFLANGQQIPENLAEASKPELRLQLAARLRESALAAA